MYKTHTLEEYNEVMGLRKKDWSLPKIFSFLSKKGMDVSYGTISDWIYTDKKPFQDKVLSKISKQPKFLTMEKSYVLGVLCGDGYIRINGGQYLVGLDVCDEDFANKFRECLTSVYGLIPSKNKRAIKSTNLCKNPKPRYTINLTSKLVVKDLLKYSKSFKTKEWIVPQEILESNLEIKSAFLMGLFDSEGSASLKKSYGVYLSVCSGNKEPLLKVKEILKNDFDINLISIDEGAVMRLKSSGYNNVKNFCDKIGFTIKRKQDKLEKGLSSYIRKGVRRYSLEFKKKTLKLLEKYQDSVFVADLLGIPTSNVHDWKNGRYIDK
ncbi:hypothetical protein HYV89_03250 [Candidatus Woesearchaeota archaeon]|nr:hypothetical protein [Candidatus Woesearchaeota archaeon]